MSRFFCAHAALVAILATGLIGPSGASAQDETFFATDSQSVAGAFQQGSWENTQQQAILPMQYCADGSCGTTACGDCYTDCCGDCGCDVGCCECDPCCTACCPPAIPRNFVFGEFLYLAMTDGDVAHAQQQNGIGGAGTVPFGEIGVVGNDCQPAFRVGAGCQLDCLSSIAVSYTHFESDALDSVVPPTITGGGGAVGSLVHHPNTLLTASVGPVNAAYDVDFQLADLIYRDVWRSGAHYELRYLIGGQYGHLDQWFGQVGTYSGGSAGAISTETDIKFDGGGVKFGLEGERHIGAGLFIYGRATAAAMTGRFRTSYYMTNQSTVSTLAAATWNDDRVVTQLEYEVGFAMTTGSEKVRLSAGYIGSHWGNVVSTNDLIDAVQTGSYENVGDTIGFTGLATRAEFRW